MTFGMRKGATQLKHLEPLGLEPTHVRWMICHMYKTREKLCVCVTLCAFDEVFCLHPPSRARHSLMSVREICEEKNLHGMKESVAITLPTHAGCAILLGLVRAILLTPTSLLKMEMEMDSHGGLKVTIRQTEWKKTTQQLRGTDL